eukprot:364215-Chlamydomonas_euryale.AAC.16
MHKRLCRFYPGVAPRLAWLGSARWRDVGVPQVITASSGCMPPIQHVPKQVASSMSVFTCTHACSVLVFPPCMHISFIRGGHAPAFLP